MNNFVNEFKILDEIEKNLECNLPKLVSSIRKNREQKNARIRWLWREVQVNTK